MLQAIDSGKRANRRKYVLFVAQFVAILATEILSHVAEEINLLLPGCSLPCPHTRYCWWNITVQCGFNFIYLYMDSSKLSQRAGVKQPKLSASRRPCYPTTEEQPQHCTSLSIWNLWLPKGTQVGTQERPVGNLPRRAMMAKKPTLRSNRILFLPDWWKCSRKKYKP